MTRTVIDSVRAFIERSVPRLRVLHLSWFGGEPLLASGTIMEISEFAMRLCESAPAPIKFSGDVTTNAFFLTSEMLSRLVSLNQKRFEISLDGFASGHDQTRRMRGGTGTFDKIWKHLIAARDTKLDFTILIRLHITPENDDSLKTLAQQIVKEFPNDDRFLIGFKRIENLGGPNRERIRPAPIHHTLGIVESLGALFKKNGFKVLNFNPQFESAIGENTTLSGEYICYAAKPNSLVIRSDGSLSKCTVALDNKLNNVGSLNEDGSVAINANINKWLRGFGTMAADVLGCPMHGLCKN